jgi:hypothetical protein
MRRSTRIARTAAAVALAIGAFTAPTAFAQQDLRSADARDAARAAVATQDLRSPDTRDAAVATTTEQLRWPDQRAAVPATGHSAPVRVAVSSQPAPVARSSGDSRWPNFGIALLVVATVAFAGAVFVLIRRRSDGLVAAVADGTRDWRRGAGL